MNAHNAGDDAKMTMELYSFWLQKGQPDSIPIASLRWHIVNVHSFSEQHRIEILWNILRPIRAERDVVIEDQRQREGKAFTYKLKFRLREELEAYLMLIRGRITKNEMQSTKSAKGYSLSWRKVQDVSTGGKKFDCTAFKLHVYEQGR